MQRNATGQSAGTVRVAVAADRHRIVQLVNEAFAVERRIKKGGADRLDAAGQEMRDLLEHGVFLVMEEDGELIAAVYLKPTGERCYLGLLSVAPSRHGMGLGRVMTEAAEQYARDSGCHSMDLRVVSPRREKLVPLYTRLGYAERAREEYPKELQEKMVEPGYFICMTKRIDAGRTEPNAR